MEYVKFVICGVSLMGMLSCQSLKSTMDIRGLGDYAQSLEAQLQAHPPVVHPLGPSPAAVPQAAMSASPIERQPLNRWKLSVPNQVIIGEELTFPAPEGSALGPSYFYYFHPEHTQGSKVILWAPGFGVSDLAFLFIKRFFRIELELGWDVLVWVPPYHLERQAPGKKSGEGLISSNLDDLVANMGASVRELDMALGWLKQNGYERIGAWGGSFGAANLLLLAQDTELDHLAVMIPLLDWNTIWASSPFAGIQKQFESAGIPAAEVESVLAAISPRYARPPEIKTDRIQVLIADYDQLTPLSITNEYVGRLGSQGGPLPQVYHFRESHSTILMNGGVYRAYREFLQAMK